MKTCLIRATLRKYISDDINTIPKGTILISDMELQGFIKFYRHVCQSVKDLSLSFTPI